jgi:hypothetical protein
MRSPINSETIAEEVFPFKERTQVLPCASALMAK